MAMALRRCDAAVCRLRFAIKNVTTNLTEMSVWKSVRNDSFVSKAPHDVLPHYINVENDLFSRRLPPKTSREPACV